MVFLMPDEYDYLIAEMFFSGIRLPARITIGDEFSFINIISNLEIAKQWKYIEECKAENSDIFRLWDSIHAHP